MCSVNKTKSSDRSLKIILLIDLFTHVYILIELRIHYNGIMLERLIIISLRVVFMNRKHHTKIHPISGLTNLYQ